MDIFASYLDIAVKHWNVKTISDKISNQVGEHCQAIYSVDGQYHDAKIEEINADGEVSVRFKGFR